MPYNRFPYISVFINSIRLNLTFKVISFMALLKKINPFSKPNNDTGFGSNASSYGGRFINRDGTFNIDKVGMPSWERFSIFHTMLNLHAGNLFALFFFSISVRICYIHRFTF